MLDPGNFVRASVSSVLVFERNEADEHVKRSENMSRSPISMSRHDARPLRFARGRDALSRRVSSSETASTSAPSSIVATSPVELQASLPPYLSTLLHSSQVAASPVVRKAREVPVKLKSSIEWLRETYLSKMTETAKATPASVAARTRRDATL